MVEDIFEAIELLAKHEDAVQHLYEAYAERFTPDSPFWREMASNELSHAEWVRKIAREIKDSGIKIEKNRFKGAAIKTSIDYITSQIRAATAPDLTPKKAVAIAVDLENSLLEKKFFEIFATDSTQVKKLLDFLRKETEDHAGKVSNYLKRFFSE